VIGSSESEQIVGPEMVQAFAASAEMCAGAAARLLPGSRAVAGSQADGADVVRDPASILAKEALGGADSPSDLLNGGGAALNLAQNSHLPDPRPKVVALDGAAVMAQRATVACSRSRTRGAADGGSMRGATPRRRVRRARAARRRRDRSTDPADPRPKVVALHGAAVMAQRAAVACSGSRTRGAADVGSMSSATPRRRVRVAHAGGGDVVGQFAAAAGLPRGWEATGTLAKRRSQYVPGGKRVSWPASQRARAVR
jgi:hypothetical protein